jgi:hypothetical protein
LPHQTKGRLAVPNPTMNFVADVQLREPPPTAVFPWPPALHVLY